MNPLQVDLQDKIITQIGVEAMIDFYQTIAIDYQHFSDIIFFATGCESPFLNIVIDTRDCSNHSSEIIALAKAFFYKHSVPWVWLVTKAATQDLQNNGFALIEEVPAMYFSLSNPISSFEIESFSIREVERHDNLSTWIEPLQEGFPSDDNGECYRKLNANLLQKGELKLRHFVGFYHNEIATAATLFLSNKAVMLHNLATKKAFRNKGLGTAITLHMMLQAKQLNYKHCFLESSIEGFNLYRKIGFKIYTASLYYQMLTLSDV